SKSNFVLRWEISNAAATLAAGDAQSEVFIEGGFEWIVGVRPNGTDKTGPRHTRFTLTCNNRQGGEWKCEANVEFVLRKRQGLSQHIDSKGNIVRSMEFNEKARAYDFISTYWRRLVHPSYPFITNGMIVAEFRVKIISAEGNDAIGTTPTLDLSKLISLNEMSNVTLVMGEKKLRVSKEYLANHSPVFSAMFFGNYAEKGKEEVEIKDVIYEEFLDLLHVIYSEVPLITYRGVLHILKLADRFEMMGVMNQVEMHFIRSTRSMKEKLSIADQYRLTNLRYHCLNTFTKSEDMLQQFKASPETASYSGELRLAIFDRLMKL
ncbi:hypothetical protein PENTCL1PPCAC_591, partial [Pristionchus entomophagus]